MAGSITSSQPYELVRFLLDRIDEDEAVLKKVQRQRARGIGAPQPDGLVSADRLRLECASKRQLIGSLQQLLVLRDQPAEKTVRDAATQMLHALATPYAAHVSYRKTWGEPLVSMTG